MGKFAVTQQSFRQLMTTGQIVHFTKGSLLKMRRLLSRAQTSPGEGFIYNPFSLFFPLKSYWLNMNMCGALAYNVKIRSAVRNWPTGVLALGSSLRSDTLRKAM